MSKLSIHRPAGFGLVEIMVGMVIGMLAVIVMLQVFALSEERKRTTTSGGDAQSTGVITFYQLQKDIGQAGYGFAATDLFNCNITWAVASGSNLATAIPLAPVTINPPTSIIPAGDPNTDRLLVIYGNTNGEPQGNPINSSSGTGYKVQMPSSFTSGDKVVAAPTTCASDLILDRVTGTDTTTVTVATGSTGVTLYNLGPAPTALAYRVRNGNLTVCDYIVNDCGLDSNKSLDSVWIPIASNIVSMKALYARDASVTMDGIPDTYDQITPGSASDTSGIAPKCGWARISGVSMALVARNSQYDKSIVTTTARNAPAPVNAPTWAGNATASIIATTGTLGPDAVADEPWKHYRYKVFQGVVPIRNLAWMGVPKGC